MPSRIQRVPPGYLSFLGIKGTGQNPADASDYVTPTVDLSPFYVAQDLAVEFATTSGVTTAQTLATVTIPPGEAWRVQSVGYNVATWSTTGQVVRLIAEMRAPSSTVSVPLTPIGSHTNVNTNDVFRDALFVPQPFVAMPGTRFDCRNCLTLNTGTIGIAVVVMFQRLPI